MVALNSRAGAKGAVELKPVFRPELWTLACSAAADAASASDSTSTASLKDPSMMFFAAVIFCCNRW